MDLPDTSSQKSSAAAAARRARAIASGLVVDIGGLSVRLRAEGIDRAEALERALGASMPSSEPAAADIFVGETPIEAPPSRAEEAYDGLEIWRSGDELIARRRDGLSARSSPTDITIGGRPSDLLVEVRQILQPALTHLLAHTGRYVLHAGAMVVDDAAVLVFGGTGAGKSTLLAVALARGMGVLSDDLVVVRASAAGLEACGVAKQLALPGDLMLPDGATPLHDRRGRMALPAEHLLQGWCPVAGSLLVGHGANEHGLLTPLAGLDAFDRVIASFLSAPDPTLLRAFYPVGASLVRLPFWLLEHARPASSRVSAASVLIGQVEQALRNG